MVYIDTNELFKCETCRRYKGDKCLAWCENGECYSPNMKKMPTADVVPKSEVERLMALNSQLEEKFFEERGKVERLHSILLQFTDIVHKWGTKNNIDTSEISLVPIMNEEADSIIQKANQEVAREIFEEIEKIATAEGAYDYVSIQEIAELKKKYTEDK